MPALLRPLPLRNCSVDDQFWSPWQQEMATRGLPHQWRQAIDTGRLENLRRAARGLTGGFQGYRFNDSDVYKLLEASAYATSIGLGDGLETDVAEAIDLTTAAQQHDGYINSFVQLDHPEMKWRSLNALHEMYCIGHLIEAGVADFEATGRTRLLNCARASADCMIREFGPDTRLGYADHQVSEMALVRLARATGDHQYQAYAAWQTSARGSRPSPFEAELNDSDVVAVTPGVKALYFKDGRYDGAYAQDDLPLKNQSKPVGHAVRAMYFYCGAVDALGDDAQTMASLKRIWDALVQTRMYVTGGIGSSGRNEGFTDDYDLPNLEAYSETCASIGLVFWAWRMFLQSGHGKYLDVMHRVLYNAVLSGVSQSCDRYFYDNPLESDGRHERAPWFSCACCPPNIARLVLSLGQYVVAGNDDTLALALPVGGTYRASCGTVAVEGNYPWSGDYTMSIQSVTGLQRISMHVPEWAESVSIRVNGAHVSPEFKDGMALIDRVWSNGDTIEVSFPMKARRTIAHQRVLPCSSRVALERGPLVYCLEQHDLRHAPHHWSLSDTTVSELPACSESIQVRLRTTGFLDERPDDSLYSSTEAKRSETMATFVPYYTWANRGPNAMQVWVRSST